MSAADPPFLPYGRQSLDEDDIAAVAEVLRGAWLTGGPAVVDFEQALGEATGANEAIACANGTAALHMAALAGGIGPGDVAIVPTLTFLATANCIRYAGGEIVFADVDPKSGLLTAESLERALWRAEAEGLVAKAVLPVHMGGQSCDMEAIGAISARHGLLVIEDCCHALGTVGQGPESRTEIVGSCGHSSMSAFSFHPVKTITTGEGGAVTTNDESLASRLRLLRSHGMVRDAGSFMLSEQAFGPDDRANPWYYEMAELGFNYRLDDIGCALGITQLAKLPKFAARRQALARRYDDALEPLAPLVRTIGRQDWCRPVWHLYQVLVDFEALGLHRAEIMRRLSGMGIGSQVHYLPVHRQPYYRKRYGLADLPGADRFYEQCLSLPLYPAMSDSDVDRVVAALREIAGTRA
jgi:UDP-4-amino-4,6-dideoxy-N-acetyl-beta-L-altrosamine transaminase